MKDLESALSKYFLFCQFEKNLSSLTIKAYRQDLNQFISLIKDVRTLQDIDKEVIRTYVRSLFEARLKETSINRKIASLKTFFRYLEVEDDIPVSPFRKLNIHIKTPKRVPRYLSINDVRLLMRSTRTNLQDADRPGLRGSETPSTSSRRQFFSVEEVVVLELLFCTGIRVSELCNLNLDDVDLIERTIRVAGKGYKERTVVITHDETIKLIDRFILERKRREPQIGALLINRLGRRMQPHSVRILLRRISVEAKFPSKVTPHMFRHTIATLLLENGVDTRFVQKFLGHSSILTTQIYTHLSTAAEREMIGNHHPRNFI